MMSRCFASRFTNTLHLALISILLRLPASNTVDDEPTITCGSFISGTITAADNIKEYWLETYQYADLNSILINLCPPSVNVSSFDTIVSLYDWGIDAPITNDDGKGCNGPQSQLRFTPTPFKDQYTGLSGYPLAITGYIPQDIEPDTYFVGTYHMEISCNRTSSGIQDMYKIMH